MANSDLLKGFRPVCYRSGAPYNGSYNIYYKDATAGIIGVGDPVIRGTNSSDPEGQPEIVRATTGAAITGVVVGIVPTLGRIDQPRHLAAADIGYVMVADDPNLLFEVQDNGGATGLIVTQIGEHIDSVAAINADTTLGYSKYEIDTEAVATGNTWRLEKLVRRADNAVGANAKWLVSANLHTEVNASATTLTEI
jgi:hypothetical protein